jgi:hypothetical protein
MALPTHPHLFTRAHARFSVPHVAQIRCDPSRSKPKRRIAIATSVIRPRPRGRGEARSRCPLGDAPDFGSRFARSRRARRPGRSPFRSRGAVSLPAPTRTRSRKARVRSGVLGPNGRCRTTSGSPAHRCTASASAAVSSRIATRHVLITIGNAGASELIRPSRARRPAGQLSECNELGVETGEDCARAAALMEAACATDAPHDRASLAEWLGLRQHLLDLHRPFDDVDGDLVQPRSDIHPERVSIRRALEIGGIQPA